MKFKRYILSHLNRYFNIANYIMMKRHKKAFEIKYILYITASILIINSMWSCGSSKTDKTASHKDYPTLKLDDIASDSTEYDIIITDVGYESFLATQKPVEFYSQRYYENWNRYYVTDWNIKVNNSMYHSDAYRNVFDMYIDYSPSINYGIEVNYKLYYYFRFVEKRYGVRFSIPRAINY